MQKEVKVFMFTCDFCGVNDISYQQGFMSAPLPLGWKTRKLRVNAAQKPANSDDPTLFVGVGEMEEDLCGECSKKASFKYEITAHT